MAVDCGKRKVCLGYNSVSTTVLHCELKGVCNRSFCESSMIVFDW